MVGDLLHWRISQKIGTLRRGFRLSRQLGRRPVMKIGTPIALIFGFALAVPTAALAQHVDVGPGGVTVGVSRDRDHDRDRHQPAHENSRDHHHHDRPNVRVERGHEHHDHVDRGDHHRDASRHDRRD